MRNAFSYTSLTNEAIECISRFLRDRDLVDLFNKLFLCMNNEDPNCIIRGRTEEIIGVSHPGDRYFFYIVPNSQGYSIKFRSCEKTDLDSRYTELFVRKAMSEIGHNQCYRVEDQEIKASTVESDKKGQEQIAQELDNEPFYKKYGVNPDDYKDLGISNNYFSNRAYNCLARNEVDSFDQLLRYSEKTLDEIRWLGRKTRQEIVDKISFVVSNGAYPVSDNLEKTPHPSSDTPKYLNARERIYRHIRQEENCDYPNDILVDDCISFCSQLMKWTEKLIEAIPKMDERNKKIVIQRVVRGETLEKSGADYNISRERVRQILIKANRRIKARVIRFPDSRIRELMDELDSFCSSFPPEVLRIHLNYALSKHKYLCELLFSFLVPGPEYDNTISLIHKAPLLKENQLEKENKKPEKPSTPKIPYMDPIELDSCCPKCGSPLLIRLARRGSNAGKCFVGCSGYPRCFYARQLSQEEVEQYSGEI